MNTYKKIFLSIVLLFVMSANLYAGAGAGVISVLNSIYSDTNGDSWTNNSNWRDSSGDSNGDPCTESWYGVTCAGGSVIGLDLHNNNLNGTITTAVNYLGSIKDITLNNNHLYGTIPAEFEDLSLDSISLHNNFDLSTSDGDTQEFINQTNGSQGAYALILATNTKKIQNDALSAFYSSTNGGSWTTKTNWLTGDPCDNNWYKVTCDGNGIVTGLKLYSNNLTGTIPSEIGKLNSLTELNLYNNALTGTIPSQVYALTKLTILKLYRNQLGGSIPTAVENLTSLLELALSFNELQGEIPTSIGNLSQLQTLDLYGNNLYGNIPSSISNLTSLSTLSLNSNTALYADSATQTFIDSNTEAGYKYADILSSNDNAPQRDALIALYNATEGGNWSSSTKWLNNENHCDWYGVSCTSWEITGLDLHTNNLVGTIPSSISDINSLTSLVLNDNTLSGTIPSTISDLTLSTITLHDNHALFADSATQTFIDGVGGAGTYANIEATNAIKAQRDALVALYNATDGGSWSHNANWLDGDPCTNSWYGVTCTNGDITRLSLGNSNLVGSIPADIGDLTNLTYLSLSPNNLVGSIPSTIENLVSLTGLYLKNNTALYADSATQTFIDSKTDAGYKYADIFSTNDNAPQRDALIVFYNATAGGSWTDNTNWLNNENLCDWYGVTCTNYNVTDLNLSNNHLAREYSDSTIPEEIEDLTELTSLVLNDNLLGGAIPPSISTLASLTTLALNNNKALFADSATQAFIDGVSNNNGGYANILSSNANAPQRDALIALYNATEGGSWTDKTNWLNNENLCDWYGVICSGGDVTGLLLGNNNLVGSIPADIGDLTSLISLNLSTNNLVGSIPSTIENLVSLTGLYLISNTALYASSATQTFIDSKASTSYKYADILSSNVNAPQRDALIALYNATDGGNWSNNTNWLNHENYCDWYGVTCTNYNVTGINLSANQLLGTIHSSIDDLTYLLSLDLHDNRLNATIPSSISNLANLMTIALYDNQALYADSATQTFIDGVGGAGTYANIETTNAINSQRDALVALYNATNGGSWSDNAGWLEGNPCNWTGVTCVDGDVTELNLRNKNLVGIIPADIEDLTNLSILDLSQNSLTGSIPSEIESLGGLTTIILEYNELTEVIPAEIGSLSNLIYLKLNNNHLSGYIDISIPSLANLETLLLFNNRAIFADSNTQTAINGITNTSGGYSNIVSTNEIEVQKDYLVHIYNNTDGDNWVNKTNWLTEDNPCIWAGITCTDGLITELDLSNKHLKGVFPSSVSDLDSLVSLKLNNNQLHGDIAPTIANLSLNTLILGANYALYADTDTKNFINSVSGSGAYQAIVDSNKNNIEIDALIALYDAAGGDNWIDNSGWKIKENPCDWTGIVCNNNYIIKVLLTNNNLIGTIPTDIGVLIYMEELQLNNNHLSGNIPASIGNLTNLEYLYLNNNKLYGDIPSEITNLSNISHIDFNFNQSLHGDSATQSFINSVANNSGGYANILSTSIASEQKDILIALYDATSGDGWTDNTGWKVEEDICDWFGVRCRDGVVSSLILTSNNLVGNIPTSIDGLVDLTYLDISINQLSGTIPSEIGNLIKLEYLDLYHNSLVGEIPASIGNLELLTFLRLSYNQLSGTIPSQIGDLTNLVTMYISVNQLSGEIPSTIYDLPVLSNLYLNKNQLEGELPIAITNLTAIDSPELVLSINTCLYSNNAQVQDFIEAKSGMSYEDFLATQTGCPEIVEEDTNLVPVIMYLLN